MTELPDLPNLKFSEAGLRGIVGETFTPDLAAGMASAFAAFLSTRTSPSSGSPGNRMTVAIGRDTRPSGEEFAGIVSSALARAGIDVMDLGIVPIPTLEYFVRSEGMDGGIGITASHNPIQWNALKFISRGGYFISRGGAAELRRIFEEGDHPKAGSRAGTITAVDGAAEGHISRILEVVDADLVRGRRFSVACDPVSGAASGVTPVLLDRLGCDITMINNDISKAFPRDPEPRPANLAELAEVCRAEGADIGFAQDPDADRLVVVAEGGRLLSEEYTLALAAEHLLSGSGGDAAVNLSTSMMTDHIARRHGGRVYRARIGEINVSELMREKGCAIGGEGNGGVMHPAVHECRDSLTGIALILEMAAARKKPIGALADELPSFSMKKEKIPVPGSGLDHLFDEIRAKAADIGGEIDETDGIRIAWPERWIHVRASNTEPILRVIAEAASGEEADLLIRDLMGGTLRAGEKIEGPARTLQENRE